jgi:hypothetical protein
MASEESRLWVRRLSTLVLVVALLSPVLRNEDGLPLSTYPMYAGTRSRIVTFVSAVGVGPDGQSATLSMPEIAQTRDPLIAQAFLNDAVGRGDVERVCEEISSRVGRQFVAVEIATERRDVVRHVRGHASVVDRTVHVTCPVGG